MGNESAAKRAMLRFSLYGFLKNQTYYEPFLILAFREKGLSFFMIGLLVGFRGLCINLFEVPSGAVADLYGRRKAMIVSFGSYIASFVVLATSQVLWHLFAAMFLFSLGEVFRTGTHKAMIFDWLRAHGRADERTQVYGYTRSWSKMGSAVAAIIAAALIFWRGRYSDVFWLCLIPYAANIVNFLGYPPETEGARTADKERRVVGHVWAAARQAWENRQQRRLILESTGFEGTFEIAKDYLQPTIEMAAMGLPILVGLADRQRTALLVGAVYFVLYVLSSVASRQAHRTARRCGGDDATAHAAWIAVLASYGALIPALYLGWSAVAIPIFVLIYLAQNIWRPVLVSRLNAVSDPALAATTLSIESQTKSLYAVAMAPALGLAVDRLGLWPLGIVGAAAAALALMTRTAATPTTSRGD
ncbi:MAG TPA: MFS transporter [Candidatus Hydrogenedentes bacterium]|nr:MFS transporter [Candidatus Hydrogenedentota bacterium]HPG66252.1 MFS transporter [Candidatus Hydrogenedentota bacterium]